MTETGVAVTEVTAAGVYVHIPFCLKKCIYCAFNSYPTAPSFPASTGLLNRYVSALTADIRAVASDMNARGLKAETLYVGGGTPTVLGAESLAGLVTVGVESFRLPAGAEITVECNPATVDPAGLRLLREAGVNRLSIGAQAFQDRVLHAIGRVHSVDDTLTVFHDARRAGFDNLNLDLMFGVPEQRQEDWMKTVETAVNLGPEHLSLYPLDVEEGTPLRRMVDSGSVVLPAEDDVIAMWEYAVAALAAAGYERYEISNYAKPGRRSRHNLIYWRNGEYAATGAGASSHYGGRREERLPDPEAYCRVLESGDKPIENSYSLTDEDSMAETMIMGLRLSEGVHLGEFRSRFGRGIEEAFPGTISRLAGMGVVRVDGERIRLTERGVYVANTAFREFIHPLGLS